MKLHRHTRALLSCCVLCLALSSCSQILDSLGMKGSEGASIIWKGSLASAPDSPSLNWAYYDTTLHMSFIWDGDSWETLAVDGDASAPVCLTYNGSTIGNGGSIPLGTIYYQQQSQGPWSFALKNKSFQRLKLRSPVLLVVGSRYGTDCTNTLPELSLAASSPSEFEAGDPLDVDASIWLTLSFLTSAPTEDRDFRKRYRLYLESEDGEDYSFDFDIEGSYNGSL